MDMVRPKFMRVSEFAAYAGLSKSRVYRLADANKITLKRLGGATLVDVDAAMKFLEGLPDYRAVPPTYWGKNTKPPKCR
jgi:excisionase family DNA binding protein